MKEIIAVLRMNMMNKTKQGLIEEGISSMTAFSALGRGKGIVDISLLKGAEKGYEEAISQLGETPRLIPKRVLIIVVPDKLANRTIKTIIRINQTGKSGDGKIFVTDIENSFSVRTALDGDQVLDEA